MKLVVDNTFDPAGAAAWAEQLHLDDVFAVDRDGRPGVRLLYRDFDLDATFAAYDDGTPADDTPPDALWMPYLGARAQRDGRVFGLIVRLVRRAVDDAN